MKSDRALPSLAILLCLPLTSWAGEPIIAGKQYPGGSELRLEGVNADFTVPDGWIGLLPVGGDSFVLRSTQRAGMMQVFLTPGDQATLADSMASVVSVEDDVNLIPVKEPKVTTGRITNSYYVTNTNVPSKGYAVGLTAQGDYGIGIIGVGPME
ncbi:MAG: hypothetical protein ACPG4N_07560, partial [Gammaproteobacteria bacterium]